MPHPGRQLSRQNERVKDTIEAAARSIPARPNQEFDDSLMKVRAEASHIAELAIPPDPCTPEFREALAAVQANALAIVETASY